MIVISLLEATKIDLRHEQVEDCVSTAEGISAFKAMKANAFVECSAKKDVMVKEAITEALRASVMGVPEETEEENNWCICRQWYEWCRIKWEPLL